MILLLQKNRTLAELTNINMVRKGTDLFWTLIHAFYHRTLFYHLTLGFTIFASCLSFCNILRLLQQNLRL